VDNFEGYINDLKEAVRIEDVVGEDEDLGHRRGQFIRGLQHDSLVIDVQKGTYHWNSRGEWGDVIQWLQDHRGMDFKAAVGHLAELAGMEPPSWSKEGAATRLAAQARIDAFTVAARHYVLALRRCEAALDYCHARGWEDGTIRDAGLGYWDGDQEALRAAFSMHGITPLGPPTGVGGGGDKVARALLGMPAGMLVYPHVIFGRVRYVSARGVGAKRHWNPPRDLVGERLPMWNHVAIPGRGDVVVVEGQADCVTLGQWGIPAVALAGVKAGDTEPGRTLLKALGTSNRVFVGLDSDDAGAMGARALAESLGPTIHVVRWPDHDVNDWLRNDPKVATSAAATALLGRAPTFIEVFASSVGDLVNSRRVDGLKTLMKMVRRLDDFERAEMRTRLAKAAGIGVREFDRLLKAAQPEEGEGGAGGEEDGPLITVQTVGGMIGENLVELVYVPPKGSAGAVNQSGGETALAVRTPEGEVRTVKGLEVDGIGFVPVPPESQILMEGVVRFAPGPGDLLSTRELVRLIQSTIKKYVDVDVFYETLAAYYVLFTWMYDAFNTLPYLRMIGDAGTGKSRFLQVVGSLCYRPILVSGAATVSPVFRLLDRYRGTLVLDEADFGKSDEAADIVKILNTGYQRAQGIVLRAGAKENNFDPEVFIVYGPKILAGRKRFEDWAVESRCLTKEMGGPTVRTDIPIELPRDFWREEVPTLQGMLLRYRLEHWQPERELDYDQLDKTVEPRLNQVMLSLVSIVDDADLRDDLRGFMRDYNKQLIAERGMTLTARCLEAICAQHDMDATDLSLKSIAKRMNQIMDFENLEEDEVSDSNRRVTPKKAGTLARSQLQLQTGRSGANGRYAVVWDEVRVNALRARYGVDDERLGNVCAEIIDMERRELERRVEASQRAQSAFGGR
jgi:hypothetical protein